MIMAHRGAEGPDVHGGSSSEVSSDHLGRGVRGRHLLQELLAHCRGGVHVYKHDVNQQTMRAFKHACGYGCVSRYRQQTMVSHSQIRD